MSYEGVRRCPACGYVSFPSTAATRRYYGLPNTHIGTRVGNALARYGLDPYAVASMPDDELLSLPQIGRAGLDLIGQTIGRAA